MSTHDNLNSEDAGGKSLPPDYATRPEAFRHPPESHPVTLSPEDAAAVDEYLAAAQSRASGVLAQLISQEMQVPPADAARVARVAAWAETLAVHRVAQPPMDLLDRTLSAVQADRMRIEPAVHTAAEPPAVRGARFTRRLAEYAAIAVAACVLIAVLIPGISQARDSARRAACASNIGGLGRGFDAYSASFAGALPSLAMPDDHDWRMRSLAEATPANHSNAANLLPLVRGNFVRGAQSLACPAQPATLPASWTPAQNEIPAAFRGYSYVCMMVDTPPRWDHAARTIVLADKNPLFCDRGCTDAEKNSFNHGRAGNYVLRSNGAVTWETSPDIGPGNDNIWTIAAKPNPARTPYTFKETPAPADVFLAP